MIRSFVAALVLSFAAPVAVLAAPPSPAPASFSPILEPLMPAVVNISTTQKIRGMNGAAPFNMDMFGEGPQGDQLRQLFRQFNDRFGAPYGDEMQREVSSLGSGFVIDPDGYIVTNNHVIDGASDIKVIFADNTSLPAKVVGHDPLTDLALLKVTTDKKLAYVQFGSSDALRVGDWVIAVGNPFGLGGSVSAGIVSARGRNINAGPFDDFIQTDAAINRGNSGGPLFNAQGEVVGINSAIFSPTGGSVGIGFAVPSDMARPIIEQLQKFGRTHRGWLGVKIQQVNDEIANSLGLGSTQGALVLDISPKSPALGQLQAGDVITRFDGRDVKEMRELPRLVAETPVGKKVELTVWRKGREMKLPVTLGEWKEQGAKVTAQAPGNEPDVAPASDAVLGMTLSAITPVVRQQFGLPKNAAGLLVVDVARNGVAAKNGIVPGDMLREVNQQPITTVAELKQGIQTASKAGKKFVLVRINRRNGSAFLTLPVKD